MAMSADTADSRFSEVFDQPAKTMNSVAMNSAAINAVAKIPPP
jgi:hypothetical protein